MENYASQNANKKIAIWLFICCFFILAMVAIGGVTRLTGSGLSITEWKPIHGVIPPLNDAAWQEEFSDYKLSPEYLKKNIGMSLEEFKGIFWLEFIHRLVGRITGFVFLIPFIYFLARGQISKTLSLKLVGIFILGGMQGVVGWYMVKSGLGETARVSQYWLAFHLCMAVVIYGLILWSALSSLRGAGRGNPASSSISGLPRQTNKSSSPRNDVTPPSLHPSIPLCLLFLIFLQIFLGALVAGMHAGLIYNSFPDMDGTYIPSGLFVMKPWYLNFFENATTIQFIHRITAYLITIIILILWLFSCKFNLTNTLKHAIRLLLIIVLIQVGLGIATLLHGVPVILASLHQICALLLFTNIIFVVHESKR